MVRTSIVLGLLGLTILIVALSVSAPYESVTELWLLDHRAYAEPAPSVVSITTIGSVDDLPSEYTVVTQATNITTTERIALPTNYRTNRSLTSLLRGYPELELQNGTTFAKRTISVVQVPAVQVRGLVGLRNLEGRNMTYQYVIRAYEGETESIVASASVGVASGAAVGIPVVFTRSDVLENRTRIVFELTARTEVVQFWLEPGRAYRVNIS